MSDIHNSMPSEPTDEAASKEIENPVDGKQPRKKFGLGTYLSALLVVGVATWWLFWPAFQNIRDGLSVNSWATTQATVTSSKKIKSTSGGGGTRTSYHFRYEYVVDKDKYTGWRYSLSYPSGRQALGVRSHDIGDTLTIHYNADHPSRSVVDATAGTWWNYLVLFGGLSIGIFAFWRLH